NFPNENRKVLLSILEYCNKSGIPTVFWNKEDPTHHNDRVHDFVKTASLFDYIFTTAEECVDSYKYNYGVKNVFSLPFGTNPRLFNPVVIVKRNDHVVFAGSWYENHTERCNKMKHILDNLIDNGFKLDIYNRYHGDSDPLHIWPEKYTPYLLPAKPHHEMPEVYKSSVYGLNFNTVTSSSTMFARRIFDLMSSNTLVISNYAKGIDEMFGDLVIFPDHGPERLSSLTKDEADRIRHKALHEV
ncbi:CgeB family protein, partial [Ralstonia pseudosolanacearum]|uniref:CgeB family protein n=1 Tax=Ralstonia pseudosolanacearum TaxID=1310165 RepID=UPI003CF3FD1B